MLKLDIEVKLYFLLIMIAHIQKLLYQILVESI